MSVPSLLDRVRLGTSLGELMERVAHDYNLGPVEHHDVLPLGYGDLNVHLRTQDADVVVKVFHRDVSAVRCAQYVQALRTMADAGIPVPAVFTTTTDGRLLWSKSSPHGTTYLCVMPFVEGRHWSQSDVAPLEQLVELTGYVAHIPALGLDVEPVYDSWGTMNLVAEFADKRQWLSNEDTALVEPVAAALAATNVAALPQGTVHGCVEKQNVIVQPDGALCLIDLDCMTRTALLLDLALLIANFCQGDDEVQRSASVVEAYEAHRRLDAAEKAALPTLVAAAYAMYVVKPSYLINGLGDTDTQALEWLALGRAGLKSELPKRLRNG